LREKLGLARAGSRSANLDRLGAVLALTYEAFDTAPQTRPANLHYVGPLACVPQPTPPYMPNTLGHAIGPGDLTLPDNVVAERFVPHAAVLPDARLVVTHAGHGTVMAAVSAGVPLLCTPMGRDQFLVASRVEQLGLGRVASMLASPEALRATIAAALDDDAQLARARCFAASVDVAAGLARALSVLEKLR